MTYLLCVFSLDVQIVEGVADFILSTIPFYFIIKVERNLSKIGYIKVNVLCFMSSVSRADFWCGATIRPRRYELCPAFSRSATIL